MGAPPGPQPQVQDRPRLRRVEAPHQEGQRSRGCCGVCVCARWRQGEGSSKQAREEGRAALAPCKFRQVNSPHPPFSPPLPPSPPCAPPPSPPPRAQNPAYKGKWSAPMIDNPAYKGVWAPRNIPNPDYYQDPTPLKNIGKVGVACVACVRACVLWPLAALLCELAGARARPPLPPHPPTHPRAHTPHPRRSARRRSRCGLWMTTTSLTTWW